MKKIINGDSHCGFYVNPNDARGNFLLQSGTLHKDLLALWCKAVTVLKPQIVIDVGVNFGEILFSMKYPEHSRIIGFEANKELFPYLEKSRIEHPNVKQIELIHKLASDKEDKEIDFYIHKSWSGNSSAVPIFPDHLLKKDKIKAITIDSLFNNTVLNNKSMLFKIDVEGYEEKVLTGMKNIINSCGSCIGFTEINTSFLETAGTDVNAFLSQLNNQFKVLYLKSSQNLIQFNRLDMQTLKSHFNQDEVHIDLILFSDNNLINKFNFNIEII
ncbi:FkbM family methyltransferase [Peribacillus simplex]|uniref:Methyltransferase FkbM domain-containing protein n=1 Tax=Peribacillus simplex NBRC 15720 = DSM 1321 TaxID=1349754 RepID=A0A223ENH3_9BACI|nr:FkbM family methyltransferase [Peribacillus simplex]ASS96792.1 hypothetical protein BS1321_24525 [Peribacillus simplex NBRC 15720 = DSM 1321]MEC1395791.1 FkbM family methyltransferase [Peribacillus simplex]MED3909882.1 FkbM family methyltransferase [Peribacillus simplex]